MTTDTPNKHFRSAKVLNLLINVIIAILLVFLVSVVAVLALSQFDPESVEIIQSQVEGSHNTFLISAMIILASYLFVAFLVRAIVKTTVNGNPFVSENISRLRTIWMVIIGAEIFRIIFLSLTRKDGFGVETWYQTWFLAFFIAIMAEVFRIGLELKRDQELTV